MEKERYLFELNIDLNSIVNYKEELWGAAYVWYGNMGVEYNLCIDEEENRSAIYKMYNPGTDWWTTDGSIFTPYEINPVHADWEEELKKAMFDALKEFRQGIRQYVLIPGRGFGIGGIRGASGRTARVIPAGIIFLILPGTEGSLQEPGDVEKLRYAEAASDLKSADVRADILHAGEGEAPLRIDAAQRVGRFRLQTDDLGKA